MRAIGYEGQLVGRVTLEAGGLRGGGCGPVLEV
ncbi:hypothetical protein ABH945_003767 [Paraburkholderia sp. GAS333]